MKHLKTFESYSINEEEGILGNIRKKFTGHESSDDKASAEKRINDRLAELEEKAKDGEKLSAWHYMQWEESQPSKAKIKDYFKMIRRLTIEIEKEME